MDEKIQQALTLLAAGFVIVFMVLILLIIIISIYGGIIQKAQKSSENRRERKKKVVVSDSEAAPEKESHTKVFSTESDEIPGEIIAVIAAAVDAMYGTQPHKVRSVKRSRKSRSEWGSAGVMQNTRPF